MTLDNGRQVGVPKCPLAPSPEQTQGRKSVAFYGRCYEDTAVGCSNCRSYDGSSYSNSHCRSIVKPIDQIIVTINGTDCSNSCDSDSPTSSQTPPIVYDSEWSLMTTMGWITAKSHQSQRVRVRWTSHRKLRRCKGGPKGGGYAIDGLEFDVNYKYNTTSPKRSFIGRENYETTALYKLFKPNHNIEHNNLRTSSDTSHAMEVNRRRHRRIEPKIIKLKRPKFKTCHERISNEFILLIGLTLVALCCLNELQSDNKISEFLGGQGVFSILKAEASLIIGDSAIEIQEIDSADSNNINNNNNNQNININNDGNVNQGAIQPQSEQPNELIFGSTGGLDGSLESQLHQVDSVQNRELSKRPSSMQMPGPLPPLVGGGSMGVEDITDGDKKSRNSHDYDIHELSLNDKQAEKDALKEVFSIRPEQLAEDKAIAGKVVDFELTPAGGHNKAKIKKKKKQKKEEEMFKKWGKKKKSEKKAEENKHKEMMKKKKEEEKKGKKKWGKEEHGLKKKGKFKKKKWGKKVKKGKGVKKGKKGKKFLKDVGHKNTGFKTVYHKEEWGKSSKWHDIKRQKKWDEKSKKWKKKWKKEKGKKYKGDHMKKFEKKKKSGKKYKKESKNKFKKFKKEKFEKGKKKKMEEKSKKKEGGAKKMMKESKKKKKKN